MTQHEYIFIAVSIILGLAMTRMLRTIAGLVRSKDRGLSLVFGVVGALRNAVHPPTLVDRLGTAGDGGLVLPRFHTACFRIILLVRRCRDGADSAEQAQLDMLQESKNLVGSLPCLCCFTFCRPLCKHRYVRQCGIAFVDCTEHWGCTHGLSDQPT
ncbi:MAG: hypothetical protein CM15mP120_30050 [Pseudomonadota bacterium]|nr:MAG: hypothetical protein CM15mP120_30050 [Pseudomonadota bacterium]